MISSGPEAIIATLGLKVAERATPTALDWMKSRVRGITLLLVGPTGSGKTAFSEYLNYGFLFPEAGHVSTDELETYKPMSLPIGPTKRVTLHVKQSIDTPGQHGPAAHGDLIKKTSPHAVLAILDSTTTSKVMKEWILKFCEHADDAFRNSPARRKKMRSFIVCLNKQDKKQGARSFQARSRVVQSCLVQGLPALGNLYVKSIPIMPCVSVDTAQHGSKLIDAVIATLAKQVTRK